MVVEFKRGLAQEGRGSDGLGPEKDHKIDQRTEAPLLCGQAERIGLVQPKDKA